MKRKIIITGFLLFAGCFALPVNTQAQFVIADVIKLVVTKVINAIDLAVQQVQNQTIVLQNAQKELENGMSKLQLDDITDWVQKQKDLYQEYYTELMQVKQVVADYDKLKSLIEMQSRIVSEYQNENELFTQDKHFSPAELDYMAQVYTGIMDESLENLDQALMVVNAFVTQMSDEERLSIINNAAAGMQRNYDDLHRFSNQNIQLSLQRASSEEDIQAVKDLYGIE